ncbi:hypothetical protein [Helicobacter sp. 23-1045]
MSKIILFCVGAFVLFKISRLRDTLKFQMISYRVGIALFCFVLMLFIIASVGFVLKIQINALYFYIALCGSLLFLLKNNECKILSAVAFFGVFIFAIFMALYFYDYSWDGRAYHQIGIYYLANGWNPIYEKMEEVADLRQFLSHELWVTHYLKFAEITQSCIYKAFGTIEGGKAINYIFAFGAFFYGVAVLGRFKNINFAIIVLLVFLAVFSPVVMAQIGTYYIDGCLGVAIIFVIFAMIDLDSAKFAESSAKFAESALDSAKILPKAIFILALLATASIKLTGIAYAGFIGISYLLYQIYRKDFKAAKAVFCCGAIACALIIICNVNPLLTNQAQNGHFGYPLMGKDKIDIIASQQPKDFAGNNRFAKLAKSLFGKSQNLGQNGESSLKIPFLRHSDERLGDTDTRIGGFGYYFSGIILLCLAMIALNFRKFSHRDFMFLFCVILGSVIINPECWWARYVPQMWILPFIIIIFSYFFALNKFSQILRVGAIFCLILTFLSTANFPLNFWYKNNIKSQLANLPNEKIYIYLPGMEKSFGIKLLERGYEMEILDKDAFLARKNGGEKFYQLKNVLDVGGFWNVADIENQTQNAESSTKFAESTAKNAESTAESK